MLSEKSLYDLRMENALSQEEVAASLGITRQTVSRWEHGVSRPSSENLIALSRLYGVSVETLMDGGAKTPPQEEHLEEDPPAVGPSGSRKVIRLAVWTVCVCILCAAICIPIVWAIAKNQTEEVDKDVDVVQFEDMNKDPAFIPSDKHFELGPW